MEEGGHGITPVGAWMGVGEEGREGQRTTWQWCRKSQYGETAGIYSAIVVVTDVGETFLVTVAGRSCGRIIEKAWQVVDYGLSVAAKPIET